MEARHAGMLCPVCRVDLVMADRQGVEIDYCPKCRGVWLDRGELDKVIERSAAEPSRERDYRPEPRDSGYREPRRYDDDDHKRYGQRKKKSLLGEIFDF
jgi:Zn-finger nucleic acid-binding protein